MLHSTSRSNPTFYLICLALFMLGGWLRWQSGWLSFGSPPPIPNPAPTVPALTPSPSGGDHRASDDMQDLARILYNFYVWLDRGYFRDVYQITLMPRWEDVDDSTVRFAGQLNIDEFVNLMDYHLGANGMHFSVLELAFLSAAPLAPDQQDPQIYPELLSLSRLPGEVQVETIIVVETTGTTVDRCGLIEWSRNILVARLNPGGWKVLITGGSPLSKGAVPLPGGGSYMEMWLHGQNTLAGKKITLKP